MPAAVRRRVALAAGREQPLPSRYAIHTSTAAARAWRRSNWNNAGAASELCGILHELEVLEHLTIMQLLHL